MPTELILSKRARPFEPGVVDQFEAHLAGKSEPRRLVAGEFDLALRQRDADDVDAVMARRVAGEQPQPLPMSSIVSPGSSRSLRQTMSSLFACAASRLSLQSWK